MTIGSFDHPERVPLKEQCGMEGRQPQIDQLATLPGAGATEDADPDQTTAIKASNRQHPDGDTTEWPNGA